MAKKSKKFELSACTDTLYGTCGVGLVYNFKNRNSMDSYSKKWTTVFNNRFEGGTGFNIAGFINNDVCKEAYEYFKANFQISFQSPVRLNQNSDNYFFFVVLDVESTVVDNTNLSWPEFPPEEPFIEGSEAVEW